MIAETVRVAIDGESHEDIVADLLDVEVEEDVDRAGVFAVRVAAATRPDGTWSYADDPRLSLWRRITVEIGYGDATAAVADGYVTHVETVLDTAVDRAAVEVSGMDATAVMNLAERHAAWPDKRDHEIAIEIFGSYGLDYEVQDTVVAHDQRVSTVLQAETDIRFLRRLAARNGFECRVEGATGIFRPANVTEPPQRMLVLSGGADGNLVRATVTMDGTAPTVAEIRTVDPMAKREVKRSLATAPGRALGAQPLAALRDGLPVGRVQVRDATATTRSQMDASLRAAYEPAGRFVTLSAEVDSRAYQTVLRAGRLVTVRGLGQRHSGLYYVNRVRHSVTADSYRQSFTAYRNAVGLTGQEQFAPAGEPAPILAGHGTGARRSGNRVLPARPSTTPGGALR